MHPMIQKVLEGLEQMQSKWAIYSAPLWSEKHKFNRILVIDAPRSHQIERILKEITVLKKLQEIVINNCITSRGERNCFASIF